MIFPWWKEKKLRMVWRIEKGGSFSFLVGTAHFSPFHFRKSLTALIDKVETALFEGPLDEESMTRVTQYGRQGENVPSLYEALEPAVIEKIRRCLNDRVPHRSAESYLELFEPKTSDFLEVHVRGVHPWMAFFALWSAYLNWKYSIDMEAFHLAQKLGKKSISLKPRRSSLQLWTGSPSTGSSTMSIALNI
jgi:hypothetical protein